MLLGVLLFEFGLLFEANSIYSVLFGGIGLLVVFFIAFFRLSHSLPLSGFKRALFWVYLFWNLFVILRSLITTGFSGFSPFNQYGLFSLFTLLVVFIRFHDLSLKSIFKFSYVYVLIGILITILNYKDIMKPNLGMSGEEYQNYIGIAGMSLLFLFSSCFMFLCYAFVPHKYRIAAFLAMLISTFIVLVTARRGSLFMNLLFIMLTFYLYVFSSKKGSKLLKFVFVLSLVAFGVSIFFTNSDSFSLFFTRLDESSRDAVEESFFDSFKGETLDWIFGRGINGKYYCTLFVDSIDNYRGVIETGYLYIILKGGLLSLALYLFFLLNSAYIGFFKTNNMLTKAMAFYLVAHVIYLLPFGLPSFSFEYIIVWICVKYCQSKAFRMKSDIDIKKIVSFTPLVNNK